MLLTQLPFGLGVLRPLTRRPQQFLPGSEIRPDSEHSPRLERGGDFTGRDWTPRGGVFEAADRQRLVAVPDERGIVAYLATDGTAYERLAWHESPRVNLLVVLGFLLVAAPSVLGSPIIAVVRRARRRPAPDRPAHWRAARRLVVAGNLAGVLILTGFTATLLGDTSAFLYEVPVAFRALMLVPLVSVALALAAVVATARALRMAPSRPPAIAHHIVAVGGLLAFVWFLHVWNLIGWQFG